MRVAPLLLLLVAGCGAGGDSGGGSSHLPVSGAGPFRPLEPDPTVLDDVLADLDDVVVVRRGDALGAWVTATRNGVTAIEHADAFTLAMRFGDLVPALAADQDWERGAVRAPAVVDGPPWLLFYAAGGAIGWAVADDAGGHAWQKGPGPTLEANGAEEGAALGSPAAVRLGDRVRVYYTGGGRVWAKEASFVSLAARLPTTWKPVDGDPATPGRDPMLAGAPFLTGIERVTARAGTTPAGRVRHDLYFSGPTGIHDTPTACGYAASYLGTAFEVAPGPILPLLPAARAPTGTAYGEGAVLLYVTHSGIRDGVAAALSP
jgi:hypothetical protein